MRIETKEDGAARYRGTLPWVGVSGTAFMVAIVAFASCYENGKARDRIVALERQVNGVESARAAQAVATAPEAYAALRERIEYLEADLDVCHRRWDATMVAEAAVPPPRPRRPNLGLPADLCQVLARLPGAKAFGECRLGGAAPTVPALPRSTARSERR